MNVSVSRLVALFSGKPPAPRVVPANDPYNDVQTVAPAQPDTTIAGTEKPTVTVNGHTYIVGQTYTLANGATFVPQADGSFSKTTSTPRNPTALQLLFQSQQPGAMANLQKAEDTAKNVAGAATSAVSKLGRFRSATAP